MKPPVIPGLRPEPERDGYGRYLLPDPRTGAKRGFTRATTLAHTLDDTSKLTLWKRRMVLQGAATDPTLLHHVPALTEALTEAGGSDAQQLKGALDDICDTAAYVAGANDGAGWGTALHTVTEYHDAGRLNEIQVPVDLAADLAAYEQTLTAARIRRPVDHIERIVINLQVNTAGTYDRLLALPDGRLVVGDLKSQQYIYDWLSIAIQLAQYAQADALVDPATGKLGPLPDNLDVTRGIVIHTPARTGTCHLYEVDLKQGWEAAQLAYDVRQLRNRAKRMGWPWSMPEHTQLALDTDHTLQAIEKATDTGVLVGIWQAANKAGTWTDQHTQAAAARKAQLTALAA